MKNKNYWVDDVNEYIANWLFNHKNNVIETVFIDGEHTEREYNYSLDYIKEKLEDFKSDLLADEWTELLADWREEIERSLIKK